MSLPFSCVRAVGVFTRSGWCTVQAAAASATRSYDGMVDTAAEHYKSDTQTLARWLDVSVVKKKGRAFEADTELLPAKDAKVFPLVKGYTLNSKDVNVPDSIVQQALAKVGGADSSNQGSGSSSSSSSSSGPRLVAFSFKHYGFTLVRSWLNPFLDKFGRGPSSPIPAIEICFVEYGFLSLTKNIFATNLKSQIDAAQHDLTALSFGGVMDFAAALQLPNKYTGYLVLLDGKNRVRWQGCGQCQGPNELAMLCRIAEELLAEGGGAGQRQGQGQGQGQGQAAVSGNSVGAGGGRSRGEGRRGGGGNYR